MTLEEKISMIHANGAFSSAGVPRLNIPDLVMSDGPHGVRREIGKYWEYYKNPLMGTLDSGTYLPVGICLASTWNPDLGFQYGKVLGSEAAFRKKNVILGPGINIIRTPLNGRNFEYSSEDPLLVSKMIVPYIKGVQSQGVSACVKHFAANNQELNRMKVNVEMSERALREIYLPGFKAAVIDGKVNTVMGAYNKFRGQYATHHEYLVKKILKGEWKFDGIMMSDWGAAKDTKEALLNGLDLEMGTNINPGPHPELYNNFRMANTSVLPLIKDGAISQSAIDDKVRRILRIMFRTHMMGNSLPPGEYNTWEHQQIALKVAEEGIVLLKNDHNILPLKKNKVKTIAVIGANAIRKNALGGGSSQVKAAYEITPMAGITKAVGSAKVIYSEGYRISRNVEKNNDSLLNHAVAAAKTADVVLFFGGWTNKLNDQDRLFLDAETVDKPNMTMPFEQDRLIEALVKANPNTVVVLLGGGPVDMSGWINQVSGVLQTWYSGMEGGNAIANILFGDVNPSGKLPITFPVKLEDSPAHKIGEYPGVNNSATYKEGIFLGYRYFDSYKVKPAYAFGHGLSYTTFKYSDLQLTKINDTTVSVSLKLKNTGKVGGSEVVQVYINDENSSLPRPVKELKAFQKVSLEAGKSRTLTFSLDKDAFQYFNDELGKWVLEPGRFHILVGGGSDAIKLKTAVSL